METLYDLLGALPRDDAEELRTAFRRAVKGAHPDLRPGDPDAARKFREIVRANEILGDADQRAAYDGLLKLAHLEQKSVSEHSTAARIRKIVSGLIALTGASIVTVAGYLLFMYMSAASVASIISADVKPAKSECTSIAGEPMAPPALPQTNAEAIPASNVGDPDLAASPAASLAQEIPACGNGDLKSRIADMDKALQLDTGFSPANIDPGVVFYRTGKSDRGFPDIAPTKQIEKPIRSKSVRTPARRPLFDPAAIATSPTPVSQRRTAAAQRP
jgi:curved DNA-binding protein CbpA